MSSRRYQFTESALRNLAMADFLELGGACLKDQTCVVGFGGSFWESSPSDVGIPKGYLPLKLIHQTGRPSRASDLWALGYTLCKIRVQIPLLCIVYDPDEGTDIVGLLGRMPTGSGRRSTTCFPRCFGMSPRSG